MIMMTCHDVKFNPVNLLMDHLTLPITFRYKMQSMGLVRPEDGQPLDDAYSVNLCLEQELAWVNKELDYHKKLLE